MAPIAPPMISASTPPSGDTTHVIAAHSATCPHTSPASRADWMIVASKAMLTSTAIACSHGTWPDWAQCAMPQP